VGEAEELTARFERLQSDLMNARAFLTLAGLEDSWTTQPLIEHQMDLLLPPPTPLRVPYERLRVGRMKSSFTNAVRELVLTQPLWWFRPCARSHPARTGTPSSDATSSRTIRSGIFSGPSGVDRQRSL
jgi:hypothetical protein